MSLRGSSHCSSPIQRPRWPADSRSCYTAGPAFRYVEAHTVPNVRAETADDIAGIRAVNLAAFPTSAEADLVDALRGRLKPWLSLVADDGGIVGHILFTPVELDGRPALALGPMAVMPGRQRSGIGEMLVRAGLELAHREGYTLLFVLGH